MLHPGCGKLLAAWDFLQTPVSFSAQKNGVDQTDITGSWADKRKLHLLLLNKSNGNGYDASKFKSLL